jgi:hypothetical protein
MARQARRESHVMEQAGLVVEAEQERAHRALAGRLPEATDHAVRGAPALDLLHASPGPRLVGQVAPLGDHAVEGDAGILEPAPRHRQVRRHRRQLDPRPAAQMAPREGLEEAPALGERPSEEARAVRPRQEVEDDEHGRPLGGETADAALRGMDALEQIVERGLPAGADHELAVQHERGGGEAPEGLDHLGEVARERLAGLRLEVDGRPIAEGDAPESVPLGLVLPARARGQGLDQVRLHGRHGRGEREAHRYFSSRTRPRARSRGAQRSPRRWTRARTLSMRKSSRWMPFSISRHVTGVDTDARGRGRTE